MNKRYRSMDFLRAVAILTVFLAHSVLSYGAPAYLAPLQFGGSGVDLFFVLSGWLLGGQLFKEMSNTGSINVRRFWARRWLRTLPAYYVVLLLNGFQRFIGDVTPAVPLNYLVFLHNYDTPLEFFTISWSLCVEEQFYLFIAPLLLLLVNMKVEIYRTLVLLMLLFIPSLFRYMGEYTSLEETHVRLDGCIIGVLLACVRYQHAYLWEKMTRVAPLIALAAFGIYLLTYYNRWLPLDGFGDPGKLLLALMFGSWVLVANTKYNWVTYMYIPGSRYVAERAYAIYLLHPEALAVMNRLIPDVPFLLYFTCSLLLSCLGAEVLYRIIEKPVMDLRERLSVTR